MSSNNLSLRTNKRIYQELNSGSSYNDVNGYLGLAKDAYPAVSSAYAEKAVSTWTARTYPSGIPATIRSVCWSPQLKLFVAVNGSGGGNDRFVTSTDGINWTASSSSYSPMRDVCWSAELGLFVAVGANGAPNNTNILTSPDGINWTLYVGPYSSLFLLSVCWSAELSLFVAVAFSDLSSIIPDRVLTSPDGITWSLRTSPTKNWFAVCWSAELSLFVAVSVDNAIMTSPNGINWTLRTSPVSNQWTSVCWSPKLELFVAVGKIGTINTNLITSPDGINWTARTSANNNFWYGICWSPELGLLVAVSDGSSNRIMTSPNGIKWTARTTNSTNLSSICWSPELGIFVASSVGQGLITSSLAGRPPTSYNFFDSPFNSIDSTGNWTIQQVLFLKSTEINNNSATPSALGANLLYINNTNTTSITNFTGGSSGQMLTLVFGNSNTTVLNSGTIKLIGGSGSNFAGTADDTLRLINDGTKWLEISRSIN
jgi:hypothetical protein